MRLKVINDIQFAVFPRRVLGVEVDVSIPVSRGQGGFFPPIQYF